MVSFLENLTNCDGGKKSAKQARQIALLMSQNILWFQTKDVCKWEDPT